MTDVSGHLALPDDKTVPELPQDNIIKAPEVALGSHGSQEQHPVAGSPMSQTPHTVVQYYRYLGPTAIAPGYKKISIKVSSPGHDAYVKHVLSCIT